MPNKQNKTRVPRANDSISEPGEPSGTIYPIRIFREPNRRAKKERNYLECVCDVTRLSIVNG